MTAGFDGQDVEGVFEDVKLVLEVLPGTLKSLIIDLTRELCMR